MKTLTFSPTHRASLSALLASLLLSACITTGSSGSAKPRAASSSSASPTTSAAGATGSAVSNTGQAIADSGDQISNAPAPVEGSATIKKDAGATVTSAGLTVKTLGDGISNGIGGGSNSKNPVGVTVASLGSTLGGVGRTIAAAGTTISDVGAAGSPLQPLNPLTTPVGAGVRNIGKTIEASSMLVTLSLSSGPAEQTTQSLSNAIIPIDAQATQTLGQTPAASLANAAGNGIDPDNPLVKDLDSPANGVGTAIAGSGSLVNSSSSSPAQPSSTPLAVLPALASAGSSPTASLTFSSASGGGGFGLAAILPNLAK